LIKEFCLKKGDAYVNKVILKRMEFVESVMRVAKVVKGEEKRIV
jgi:hypothetical protein